jgi:hypothetical protein
LLSHTAPHRGMPYQPVLEWEKRLRNPLRMRLEEEVDDRVSHSLVEIYMDEGKSGWEERETGRHEDNTKENRNLNIK